MIGVVAHTIGGIKPNGGDGRHGGKGNWTAKAGQCEKETEHAGKPDYIVMILISGIWQWFDDGPERTREH